MQFAYVKLLHATGITCHVTVIYTCHNRVGIVQFGHVFCYYPGTTHRVYCDQTWHKWANVGMCGDAMLCIALDVLLNVGLTTLNSPDHKYTCNISLYIFCQPNHCSSVRQVFCHVECIIAIKLFSVLVFGANVAKNVMVRSDVKGQGHNM